MVAERDFYERLLDGISDGVYFMDHDRIIRYWHHGAERITGFNKDEVIGTACRDNVLMHVDDTGKSLCRAEFCPALATIMDGQEREAEVYWWMFTRRHKRAPQKYDYARGACWAEVDKKRGAKKFLDLGFFFLDILEGRATLAAVSAQSFQFAKRERTDVQAAASSHSRRFGT